MSEVKNERLNGKDIRTSQRRNKHQAKAKEDAPSVLKGQRELLSDPLPHWSCIL